MQTAQFRKCLDCDTLETIYNQINCSVYQLIKSKWIGHTYNTDSFFDEIQYKTLLRLKKIIFNRMYNPSYPVSSVVNQDLITISTRALYKYNECQDCPCQDFTDFITTTTTTIPV